MAFRHSSLLYNMCHRSLFSQRAVSTVAVTPKILLKNCTDDVTKPTVVVFSWLGAKTKTSMKYVDCWTKRGHNVLLVKTPVKDLLFPKSGTNVTAHRLIDYLTQRDDTKLILHGLSVGGYLTQKVLMTGDNSFQDRISHVIYDSFTSVEGIEAGVLQVTPQTLKGIISAFVRSYVKVADMSSLNDAQHFVLNSDLSKPTFFLHSKADVVAPYLEVCKVIDARKKHGPVETDIFPENLQIPHVSIMKYLGEKAYMDRIFGFLARH